GGAWRNAVSRRDRRTVAASAGQAAARHPGGRNPARGREPLAPRRRAHRRRNESRPPSRSRGGTISRTTAVPPEPLSHRRAPPPQGTAAAADRWRVDEARRTFDERFVRAALVRSGGHRGRAAEELGVTRQGLTKLMARLGISSSSPAGDTG